MSNQDTAANEAAITNARSEGRAEGHAAGLLEGSAAAVTRINAILGSDEGKARPKAALSAALKTGMTADEAKAFLADLPEEKAETPPAGEQAQGGQSPFDAAMNRTGNPEVGGEGGRGGDNAEVDDGSDVVALAQSAGLAGFAKPKA